MEIKNYSVIYRIMHWAIAFCLLFLLLTIFLRLTWMNKENMADIMQKYLADQKQNLSREQLTDMARQIRKPMWAWHIYTGYVLTALLSIRLLLPFFGEMQFPHPFRKNLTSHERFRASIYFIFYLCLIGSLFTGLMIEFGPDNLHEIMEDIHVLSIYYLIGFIVVHLIGVLKAELSNDHGIISRMVSKKKSM